MADGTLDFPRFLELVRGHEPFAWQIELAERLRAGDLPPLLDVPTGLGKTSLIDCWAYALGTAAAEEAGVPLRLCFVVDRRLIVDAAFENACELKGALAQALGDGGPLAGVARALSARSGGGHPLTCVRMRGGTSWESRWLARPDQPAIVVGTVDQFGSRLLFRGYGTSARMRPLDAALVGTDAWLVIDEAHIAAPLVETAKRVAQLQKTARHCVARPLVVTEMTATPASLQPKALRADPRQQMEVSRFPRAAAEARRRLEARKPAALVELPAVSGAATARERAGAVGAMLGKLALRIDPQAQLVGVLCNTVVAARAAHGELTGAGAEAALLTGRCREHEREAILDEWLPLMELRTERDGRRRYVVATQTIEVGANLDLDAAVCELASLDALVQRFGRVNRSGNRRPAVSVVAHCAAQHQSDPVYGPAAEATWRHLDAGCDEPPVRATTLRQLEKVDLAPAHLDLGPSNTRRLADTAPAEVRPEPGYVPVVLGSDLERWAATSPAPEPDQAVAPFLRGVAPSAPDVYVAWRVSPPLAPQDPDGWRDWLATVRPVEWEFVAVPVWEVRGLVDGALATAPLSDQEGAATDPDEAGSPDTEPGDELLGVAYTDDSAQLVPVRDSRDVRIGSRLVLRSDLGGHDRWGWTGVRAVGEEVVPDVGDLAPTRHRGVLRLDEQVLASLLPADRRADLREALARIDVDDPDSVAGFRADLEELAAGASRLHELAQRAREERWSLDWTPWRSARDGESAAPMLRAPGARAPALEAISDADEASSSQVGEPQALAAHLHAVAELAREFATHLQLEEGLRRAVERAALWHDLGKAEPRFQAMLHDGDELAALLAEEPLAKSGCDPADPLARMAAQIAGVPRGFRHEAVSARLFERLEAERPDLVEGVDADLVQHLIASHHGTARPLFPPLVDDDPPPVSMTAPTLAGGSTVCIDIPGRDRQVDWTQPARFGSLCEGYGWWGLALLEAIVRLADMLASERGVEDALRREPAEAAGVAR